MTAPDRALARELQSRLPARLFDVHAHFYDVCHVAPCPPFLQSGPRCCDIAAWRRLLGSQVGRTRLTGALCTPFPSKQGDIDAANRFVLGLVRRKPEFVATVIVSPGQSQKDIEALVESEPKMVGFKPYHLLAKAPQTFQCEIDEYLPEWAWQIAHERGGIILLHLVKDRALSDPGNQRSIRRLCERYPNARLILAHAARGFHAPNTIKGIRALQYLPNVRFDTSAICEAEALAALLGEFGPRRILWGSDFPVSQQRGRCVTLGTGFAWITTDQIPWSASFFGQPVTVGLETLRALLGAVDHLGLNAGDLQDIFADNARRLLGLVPAGPSQTQALYQEARTRIPGGTQLLSKRPEMFAPGQWPAYFREARGCEVWDLDGKHYYDCSLHGIGATLLGFADPDVTRAVVRRVQLGSCCTLNPPEEVELAKRLCAIHPWAEQARFARTGGEAMAVAVRIARATTDRSAIAVCGYHGWHDWYLAANLGEADALRGHLLPGLDPLGVPRELRGTNFPFTYNQRDELLKILDAHGHRLAAVVMEPCRHHDPDPGFLEFVRDQAHRVGALLVFDEISIGWRLHFGGSHLRLGVTPDLAVFGKTLANGHPMTAVIGTTPAMDGAHRSFISSSYWTEGVGPAAALATLDKMARIDVPAHCRRIGARVQEAWKRHGTRSGLPIEVPETYPCMAHFAFKHDLANALKTLYIQLMLERGFLATLAIYVSLAHTDEVIDKYDAAIGDVFDELADALRKGDVEGRLNGPAAHSGFRRLL